MKEKENSTYEIINSNKMENAISQTTYIVQLEEKIVRMEANKKILLQIIAGFDNMLKTGIWNDDFSLFSKELIAQMEHEDSKTSKTEVGN